MLKRFYFLVSFVVLNTFMAQSMRFGEMWALVSDLESACADRAARMDENHRRNLKRFISLSEEERAMNPGWVQQKTAHLKQKKESQTIILKNLEKTISEFQKTGSHEGFLRALLSQRADIIKGRVSTPENMKIVPKLPLTTYSQYHDLNVLRFEKMPSWQDVLAPNAEDEAHFLRMISDTYHALIKCAWDGTDPARLGDEGWSLVNQSPSLWPFLAGQKQLADTAIEDGTVFALIKFCCDDLFDPNGERGNDFIEATARKMHNIKPKTFFLFDYDQEDTSLVGEYVALDLMGDPCAHSVTRSPRHALMRQVATAYVQAAKYDLRRLFKSLDFVHMSQLGIQGIPFTPVKHPRMSQPEARSAEEIAASFLGSLSLGAPQKSKTGETKAKKGKKQKNKPKQPEHFLSAAAVSAAKALSDDVVVAEDKSAAAGAVEDQSESAGAAVEIEDAPVVVGPAAAEGDMAEFVSINIEREMAKEYPYNYPKAVRVFNFRLLGQELPRKDLTPQQQAFVDDLFSRDRGPNKITFYDFETFWSGMGARIEREGGSHVHFVAPDNTPLWGTFVPHGRQAYGPSTIENLRSAVYWIGCRPSV